MPFSREKGRHGKEDIMTLQELYKKGSEVLTGRGLDFNMEGVEREWVLKHNEAIFQKFMFRQRAIGAKIADTKTKILNVDLAAPIMMSPITHPIAQIAEDGLLKVARGLKASGSMMSLGTPVPPNLADIVATGVPVLQTLKPIADRGRLMGMVERVEQAGVTWIGIEVDAGEGTRRVKNCAPLSLDELKEIKKRTSRPFILKGILSAWDAEKAISAGADAIVVSNHGGHTIDSLPHPLDVLDEIKSVTGDEVPIIADGGFRHGTDVLKALAFGVRVVGLGRPILLALAADGEEGIRTLINEMADELRKAMTLTGVKDPRSANREILLLI
jgi:isopentenyl diphosphate isomerase/L-lactate dehydrogenase-like FMN-dependent dehydrogenase